jgi:carbonic anhydrase
MENLYSGIEHFETVLFQQHREIFQKLSEGQQPGTLFITCSDSRIVPGLITHTGPGDLFVSRNPGNLVPPFPPEPCGESAAVEYAVEALGVKHIVVCGHTDCGAMKGLLNPASLEALPMLRNWLARFARVQASPAQGAAERLAELIRDNVVAQLGNLRTYPGVSSREAAGSLTLHGWLFDIGAGRVLVYDASARAFTRLGRTTTAA